MLDNRIIYALKCPLTGGVHYIGKSDKGIFRPSQHLTNSHSDKVKEWVEDLKIIGHKPDIEILEYVSEEVNIFEREKYFITKFITEGALLLNSNLIKPFIINPEIENQLTETNNEPIKEISNFLKLKRKSTNLTQQEFAEKAGVALTVVRKIEQNKTNINLDGILQVLKMFGGTITLRKL